MSEDKCCQVNENAKNPNGQAHTMKGTATGFVPPMAELHSTVNKVIDPTSNGTAKKFD